MSKFYLVLDVTGRITSAGIYAKPPAGGVGVDSLPEGNITDYLFVDGEYVFDPEPEVAPGMSDSDRIAALETQLAATKILLGVE